MVKVHVCTCEKKVHVCTCEKKVHVCTCEKKVHVDVGTHTIVYRGDSPPYEGPYEFTPSREEQFALILNKAGTDNIKINPIPRNWGEILRTPNSLYVF